MSKARDDNSTQQEWISRNLAEIKSLKECVSGYEKVLIKISQYRKYSANGISFLTDEANLAREVLKQWRSK